MNMETLIGATLLVSSHAVFAAVVLLAARGVDAICDAVSPAK